MKRPKKTTQPKSKVPDRLVPIVDAVVETVFARLKSAAEEAKKLSSKGGSAGSRDAARSSIAGDYDGLAGAVADLLLASLAKQPVRSKRQKKPVGKRKG